MRACALNLAEPQRTATPDDKTSSTTLSSMLLRKQDNIPIGTTPYRSLVYKGRRVREGAMKAKNDRKRAVDKKSYVGPGVSILRPDGNGAKELSAALTGGSPANCEEIVTKLRSKSSEGKKRRLPGSP
jgi:hypothetical protein